MISKYKLNLLDFVIRVTSYFIFFTEIDAMSRSKTQCGHPNEKYFCFNWVKTVNALQIAKRGAVPYIKDQMNKLVKELQSQHSVHFENLMIKITVDEDTIEKKSKGICKWVLRDRQCTMCTIMFDLIQDEFNVDEWR